MSPLTSSSANLRRCALLLNGIPAPRRPAVRSPALFEEERIEPVDGGAPGLRKAEFLEHADRRAVIGIGAGANDRHLQRGEAIVEYCLPDLRGVAMTPEPFINAE